MNTSYGIPAHDDSAPRPHRPPARFLVVIDAGGTSTARLFLDDRTEAASFNGGVEEVAQMSRGLTPVEGASGAEWDTALASHNTAERAQARVFTLDV